MKVRRALSKNSVYVVGLTPATVLLAALFIGPALWAVYSSLTNLSLTGVAAAHPKFVGLSNYALLFSDPDFLSVLLNSVVFVVGSAVGGQFVLGMLLALLLDHAERRGYKLANLAYGAILLAWVAPSLIAGFVWVAMFDFYYGSLNLALHVLGLAPVDWLGKYPMLSVILVNIWRGTAFSMLIFLGALKTIPVAIYEAARVDGANAWRRFWDHTVPNLRYVAMITLLMITISTFGTFLLILALTNGGPGISTETIALYAYHAAFQSYEIGYGSAIAVVLLVLNLFFAMVYLRWSRTRV